MYAGKIVESGPNGTMFGTPRHPYTLDGERLVTIEGGAGSDRCAARLHLCGALPSALRQMRRGAAAETGGAGSPRSMLAGMTMAGHIEVENLFVTFSGGVQAVAGISLSLAVAQTVGLVGESGRGKTTLAKALVGLNRPTSGRVRVEGRDLTGLTRTDRLWLRRRVQMIFQDPMSSLSPRFTVRRLLAEPMTIHGMDKRTRWPQVLELTGPFGAGRDATRQVSASDKQQQARRVAIARALVSEPSFLIADEPTAGLDVSVQGELLNLLSDLQKSLSLGILMVSHNLNVIGRVTDRVAVMYLGKVVEVHGRRQPTPSPQSAPPLTHALCRRTQVFRPRAPAHQVGPGRRNPKPVKPTIGLPLPHALPARPGPLPHRRAGAHAGTGRRPLRLPLPIGERDIDRIGIRTERPVFMKRGDGAHGGVNGQLPPPESRASADRRLRAWPSVRKRSGPAPSRRSPTAFRDRCGGLWRVVLDGPSNAGDPRSSRDRRCLTPRGWP